MPCGDGTAAFPEPDYAQVFDLAPVPLLLLTPDLAVVHTNRALLQAAGPILRDGMGPRLGDVPLTPDLRRSLERARDTGRPDVLPVQRYVVHTDDGGEVERFWSHCTVPVLGDHGEVVLLIHRADDVTDDVRYREVEADLVARTRELEQLNEELRALGERERRTAEQLAGLATTVSALSTAENRADLVRQLFGHGRRALRADVLALALLEPGGSQLAVVDTRSGAVQPDRRLPVQSPVPMAAAASGRPVFQEDADPAATSPLPGLRAWAALPLRIGRRPLGSLTVGWEDPQVFADDDVRVLEAYAAQCSQAVHRVARLETERRQASATRSLAESLQRSLLTSPPQPEYLEIAVRYRPAAREVQIGGDWYDAFLSPDGATTLVVGDVTGHDWTAAAVAGQLRNMLRGIASALDHRDPGQVLTALDRALGETGIATFATAVVARIEQPPVATPSCERVLRWSNAGHPPPLVIAADGTAHLLTRPADMLLGVSPDAPRRDHSVALGVGATVVFYTDGLVEQRTTTLDEGLDRLLALAPALAARPVSAVCDDILDRMAPDLSDDIALLAIRVRDTSHSSVP